MNLAVDASTLIAELLRVRGRELFQRSELRILVAEEQWTETERGLERRAAVLRQRLPAAEADMLLHADRAGRPSMALDLVEEFRQRVAGPACGELVPGRRGLLRVCDALVTSQSTW